MQNVHQKSTGNMSESTFDDIKQWKHIHVLQQTPSIKYSSFTATYVNQIRILCSLWISIFVML